MGIEEPYAGTAALERNAHIVDCSKMLQMFRHLAVFMHIGMGLAYYVQTYVL